MNFSPFKVLVLTLSLCILSESAFSARRRATGTVYNSGKNGKMKIQSTVLGEPPSGFRILSGPVESLEAVNKIIFQDVLRRGDLPYFQVPSQSSYWRLMSERTQILASFIFGSERVPLLPLLTEKEREYFRGLDVSHPTSPHVRAHFYAEKVNEIKTRLMDEYVLTLLALSAYLHVMTQRALHLDVADLSREVVQDLEQAYQFIEVNTLSRERIESQYTWGRAFTDPQGTHYQKRRYDYFEKVMVEVKALLPTIRQRLSE